MKAAEDNLGIAAVLKFLNKFLVVFLKYIF